MKNEIIIFTDGASRGNPGEGGWGAVLIYQNSEKKAENIKQKVKEIGGKENNTTNNRMELFAVISGLGALKQSCKVEVYSDSTYVVNAFNQNWIESWQKRGWKTSDNKPVENQDLWRLLLITMRKHDVSFHKVPGHQDHAENNRCDELARSEVQKIIAQNAVMAPKAAQ